MPLVERLGDVKRLLRAEAEEAVGVALQFGEIVERGGAMRCVSASIDSMARLAGAGARDDAAGFFAVGGSRMAICMESLTGSRNQVPL